MARLAFTRIPPPTTTGPLVAMAGNPNSGKTTLFNALTGLRHKVGNYPGVTVEKREAQLLGSEHIRILDLPGIYSLSARSPDETITRDILLGRLEGMPRPDALIVVIDATVLERHLFFATQVMEMGIPLVLVCNMMDQLQPAGLHLDLERLSRMLGVPVVGTVGSRGEGVEALRAAIPKVLKNRTQPSVVDRWSLSPLGESCAEVIAGALVQTGYATRAAARGIAILLLSEQGPLPHDLPPPVVSAVAQARERMGTNGNGASLSIESVSARYAWLHGIVEACLTQTGPRKASFTDRLDAIFTHRIGGKICFAAVMLTLFFSIFTLAEPLMAAIDGGIGWMQQTLQAALPQGMLRDLLLDGIIAGVGSVLIFYPQICILFLFLAVLEDTGYMARAALLMNKSMNRVGLHGKSFIPLLSSHACAIPGILATRTIENPRDRLATVMVAPLMTCSARLPVYSLLIAACLPAGAGLKAGTMFALYCTGILTAFAVARLLKSSLLRGPAPGFIIELPPYRLPRLSSVFRVIWDRSRIFLTTAGTIILAFSILLWALTYFPRQTRTWEEYTSQRTALAMQAESDASQTAAVEARIEELGNQAAAEQLRSSYAGRMGQWIEPAILPLGFNWEIGIGLLSSFAARELFVGTLGVVYSTGDADENSAPLQQRIQRATWPDGRTLFTPLVGVTLLVFYALACQCISTLAIVRQETNSWRWPAFMLGYMSLLAYSAALIVRHVGLALGWS